MSDTTLDHRAASRSLACGLLVLLAWFLRKPLLAFTAFLLHATLSMVRPVLLALGAAKAWQLAQARLETPKSASPLYPGDSESLITRAAEVAPGNLTPTR
jgi:hypothetical protein